MKRYKLDLSADEFFKMAASGVIHAKSDFEVYEDGFELSPDRITKKKLRKPRRTKAQIEAAKGQPKLEPTEAHQRAFPWEDESMNTDAA